MSYTAKDIVKLSDIAVIRKNTSMYIGSTETPTHLVMEPIDNVFDEIQAGFCSQMLVEIYDDWSFSVTDWGRGFPFDESLPIDKDPPVLACMEMSTSGKFFKDGKSSPYKIASGLHGIGLTAVNALSTAMLIEIYRDNKYAKYTFKNSTNVVRDVKPFDTSKRPFATRIYVKPNPKYFKTIELDIESIKTRLKLAKIEYPQCQIYFKSPTESIAISATINDILNELSGNKDIDWNYIEYEKSPESYKLWFTWDLDGTLTPKVLSSINLVMVHQGVHINTVYQTLRNIFQKSGYKFLKDDCLLGFRMFLSMRLVNTAFDAQVKVRLESKSDISILEKTLPQKLKEFFANEQEYFENLCKTFEHYRRSRTAKSLKRNNKGRMSTTYTKLRDCLKPGGELLIGEGESAIGGLCEYRDVNTQAVLPLRGVVPNAITMDNTKLLNNDVMKDLVAAIGTGIVPHCNIDNIRYSKILIACDADPAGKFISALLIMFFVKYMPDVIKHGYLYVCDTPLYGVGQGKKFKPLWTKQEVEEARKNKQKIRRFKGLGEFNPDEIYQFTFGDKRKLIQVEWHENSVTMLYDLFSKASMKRKLLDGQLSN